MGIGLLKIGSRKGVQKTLNEILAEKYVFSGSVDINVYDDITSNKNWINVGCKTYDFLFCRNQVISWVYAKTTAIGQPFSGLTQEDQEWAAKVYAVGKTERESVFTQDELQKYWGEFVVKANVSRQIRWTEAKSIASFELSMNDSIDLAKTTNSLSNEYISYGIEEYSVDGYDGLFDWLEGTGSFSGGTGFESKSYYTTGLTQNIMTILRDGIY